MYGESPLIHGNAQSYFGTKNVASGLARQWRGSWFVSHTPDALLSAILTLILPYLLHSRVSAAFNWR